MKRHPTIVVLGLVLAVLAVSCGNGGDSGDEGGVASLESSTTVVVATSLATDDATEEALFLFAECMRGEGIDIPDPVIGPDGFPELSSPLDFEELDLDAAVEALQTCQSFLEGVSLGFELDDQTAFLDALVEFAACMRDQGVDIDDPDISGGIGPGVFPDLDFEDPEILAAIAQCQTLLDQQGAAQP
jgi:hypothetical protein